MLFTLKRFGLLGLIIALVMGATGCSVAQNTLANAAIQESMDGKMESGSHCQLLRVECQQQFFREWETPAGKTMCTCDNNRP